MLCEFTQVGNEMVCVRADCGNRMQIFNRSFHPSQYFRECRSGNTQPAAAIIPIPIAQQDGSMCSHFLGSTRTTALVYNCGCASDQTNGVPVDICECELGSHPLCIVSSKGVLPSDSTLHRCSTCFDFQQIEAQ